MTWRSDTTQIITGGWVSSIYPGHGIRGDAVPSTGTHGGSVVYPDLNLPTDSANEYRFAEVTMLTGGWSVAPYENTSVTVTPPGGTTNGTGQFSYRLYENGMDMGVAYETVVIGTGGSADTTDPTLTGSITVSSITSTSYTATCPVGSDNIGVVGYQYRLNGGTWTNLTSGSRSAFVVSRTPDTTDTVEMRCYDSAGNYSSALSTLVTLVSESTAPSVLLTLTRNGVDPLTNSDGWDIMVWEVSKPGDISAAPEFMFTNQSTDANGQVSLLLTGSTLQSGATVTVGVSNSTGTAGASGTRAFLAPVLVS